MSDVLDIFGGSSICPNCAVLAPEGTFRCPECGTFHSSIHLEERIPTAADLKPHEPREIDPAMYSINPNADVADEHNKEIEDTTKKWQGGVTDFTIDDEEECAIKRIVPRKTSLLDAPQFEVVDED